jgi:hypothetical protein
LHNASASSILCVVKMIHFPFFASNIAFHKYLFDVGSRPGFIYFFYLLLVHLT